MTRPTTGPPAPVAPRRRRRRHRVIVPLALAAALLAGTIGVHALDQPDPTDPGFLSPVATDDDGGSRLADALRARGVTVRRETALLPALLALDAAPATLFVPAPELLHPDTLVALGELPAGRRLVLVDPARRMLESAGLPVVPTDRRWATRAVGPETDGRPCPLPEATRAGVAAAQLQRYAAAPDVPVALDRCYAGGLVRLPGRAETVVIGASDPFRNDRIAERGNEALGTGLLGVHDRVIWLDLDGPAPAPTFGRPGGDGEPAWSPTPGGGTGYDGGGTGEGQGQPGGPGTSADEHDGPGDAPDQGGPPPPDDHPLRDAFPPWFWALLLQLALVALLVVLWRARRLGPPVGEPLPVEVRSAETVLGRARLYQRARARGPTAATLRAATLDRVRGRLDLPATTGHAELAARVAERVGGDPGQIHELLYGAAPHTDAELVALARSLDGLTRTVAAASGRPTEGDPR
ncbi:DUF4350 domain-containing protein [Micromonospora sp. WMMD987]|uniref:DUF4350 domain-containing protein n=1 Tax=Micromonospora sp. WMMD987 TaxID=3016089 RepID=UPI00249A4C1A|nr:DUF4350 domain-containing protein [Micromonospora sp. WMMD987]WFE96474.1 DUF4350 domain-containing protein [Micromonospora sp. WMMD987]